MQNIKNILPLRQPLAQLCFMATRPTSAKHLGLSNKQKKDIATIRDLASSSLQRYQTKLQLFSRQTGDPEFIFDITKNLSDPYTGRGACSIVSFILGKQLDSQLPTRIGYTSGHAFNLVKTSESQCYVVDATHRQCFNPNTLKEFENKEIAVPKVLVFPLGKAHPYQNNCEPKSYSDKSCLKKPDSDKHKEYLRRFNINAITFELWEEFQNGT